MSAQEARFDYHQACAPEDQRLILDIENVLDSHDCVLVPLSRLKYHFNERPGDPYLVHETFEHARDEKGYDRFAFIEFADNEAEWVGDVAIFADRCTEIRELRRQDLNCRGLVEDSKER